MKISIIVAIAEDNVIGKRNALPWYLPADLKHFKEVTMGHHIVFGQTTHESIGRILSGRTTIVLSNNINYKSEGCFVVQSPTDAIKIAEKSGEKELMICGGAQVYKTFLPTTDRIYMTKIIAKIDGDVFFPKIDLKKWRIISKEIQRPDAKNKYPYEFQILERLS